MSVEMVFKANAQWARGRGHEVPAMLNDIMRDSMWQFIDGTNKRYDIHPTGAIRVYNSIQREPDGREFPSFILGNAKGTYNKRRKLFKGYVSLKINGETKLCKRADLVAAAFGVDFLSNFRRGNNTPVERTKFAMTPTVVNELPFNDTELVNQEKPKDPPVKEEKTAVQLSSAELMLIVKIQRDDFEDGDHSLLEKREYKSLVEKGYLSFKTEVTDKKI